MIIKFSEEEKQYLITEEGKLKVSEDAPKEIKKKLEFLLLLMNKI